jgi:pentose-5-phosphate-3-epimerase
MICNSHNSSVHGLSCFEFVTKKKKKKTPNPIAGVDGGVGPSNAGQCAAWGANAIVSGSAVFGAKDVGGAISEIRAAIAEGRKGLW